MAYVYSFPVVKGVQAKREYYIAMVPLKMLSKLFPPDEVLASGDRDHILSGVFNQFLSEKSEPAE